MITHYEILLLLKPDTTNEVYDDVKARIYTIINEENQGSVKNYDKWGKYLLAYPVEKCMYGFYVLLRFSIDKSKASGTLEKLKNLFTIRFNTVIMRHVVVALGKTLREEYCRPDSFEDAPRRDNGEGEEWPYKKSGNRKFGSRHNNSVHDEIDSIEADLGMGEKELFEDVV
jgi:small subunit ribosomal protein S6